MSSLQEYQDQQFVYIRHVLLDSLKPAICSTLRNKYYFRCSIFLIEQFRKRTRHCTGAKSEFLSTFSCIRLHNTHHAPRPQKSTFLFLPWNSNTELCLSGETLSARRMTLYTSRTNKVVGQRASPSRAFLP